MLKVSPFRSKWHYIGAPFAPSIIPSSAMFVASRSNKLLVSAGHWDKSFRVQSLEKGKIITPVAYHQGEGAWCFTGGGGGGGGIGGGKDRCEWVGTSSAVIRSLL